VPTLRNQSILPTKLLLMDDDFVPTLSDDDVVPVEKEEEEISSSEDELEEVAFDFVAEKAPAHPWDLTYARSVARPLDPRETTVDDKISNKIVSKKVSKEESSSSESSEEEKENSESEPDSDSDSDNDDNDGVKIPTVRGLEKVSAENTVSQAAREKAFFRRAKNLGFVPGNFIDFHLSRPILKAINALGWRYPTPIQAQSIPVAMQGADICASAVTGSGKTAAFLLPILERLVHKDNLYSATRALIVCPTRELAIQCHSIVEKFSEWTQVRGCLVVGGLSNKLQESALRTRPDIVVATPGRLIDHLRNASTFTLEDIEVLVLDEADRLLDLGFKAEIEEIVRYCPKQRQTMLFSATMTEKVEELAIVSLNQPVRVSVDAKLQVAVGLTQEFIRMRPNREKYREATLLALCARSLVNGGVLVFLRSKKMAHRAKIIFGLSGLKAGELHGNLTQLQRLESLEKFRDGEYDYLMCTDLAARGLDILGINVIVNYIMPKKIEAYVHRVGRTARWGNIGTSISFIGDRDRNMLKQIVKNSKETAKNRIVPPQVVQKYYEKIEAMEDDIAAIIEEEKEERVLRTTEERAQRVENLIKYEKEIYSRPRRTWFQSQKEKREQQEISAFSVLGLEDRTPVESKTDKKFKEKLKKDPYAGLSRKKRRNKMAAEGNLVQQKFAAKAAKRKLRGNKSKMGFEEKRPNKRRKTNPFGGGGGGSLFSSELQKGKRVAPASAGFGDDSNKRNDTKKRFKKGGTNRFKSKKRYKRRK